MNCRGWNPHIALYVEGDLERNLAHQLEAHLVVCEECRAFADELRESQSDVRLVRAEIIDTAVLNRVRGRVLDQVRAIERRRTWMNRAGIWLWGGFRWRYAMLGTIALVVFAVGMWRLTAVRQPVPPPSQVASTSTTPVESPAVRPAASRPRRLKPAPTPGQQVVSAGLSRRVRESAGEAPAVTDTAADSVTPEHKETLVQILTDDPNVVIYWLIDQTGGF